MKSILVKYTVEVPGEKIDKACKIARMGKNDMLRTLKCEAIVGGKSAVNKYLDFIINNKKGEE
jgi:hypothetical protein